MQKIRSDKNDTINRFFRARGFEESGIGDSDSLKAVLADFFDFLADHGEISGRSDELPPELKAMVERRSLIPFPMEAVLALLEDSHSISRLMMDGQEVVLRKEAEPERLDDGTVLFGSWPQGEHGEREALQWIAAVREEKRQLLVSRKAIMSRPFDKGGECSWEQSDICRWLNNTFYQHAFSEEEKELISFSSSEGVFLLSDREVGKFISAEEDRRVKPTALAMKYGAGVNEQGYAFWWLRSTGKRPGSIACVDPDGTVDRDGFHCGSHSVTVRPALWIVLQDEEA